MRYYTFMKPPQVDAGVFLYIYSSINEEKIPYKDSWDHKPPLIYFLFGLLFKFFPNECITISIFECFWILLISFFVFIFIENFFDSKTTYLTSLLFVLYAGNSSFAESYGLIENLPDFSCNFICLLFIFVF